MLLTSVIIILREVLEAALVISVLLALGDRMQVGRRWASWGVGIGLLGAMVYAATTATVSDWLDGVGQEVVNAFLQIAIYCCLTLIIVLFTKSHERAAPIGKSIALLMMASVSLAIVREGSEILIYLSSFTNDPELLEPILLGGMVGAGIGTSVGALTYYLLLNVNRRWSPYASIVVVMLIAAGMASQATSLLIQADWLPSQLPLWDTSGWVSESSVTGQLLYALIGYEATPTPIQVMIHFSGLLLPAGLIALIRKGSSKGA
jgi:high-affinity iron transporter